MDECRSTYIWHIHQPRGQATLEAFIVHVSPTPWQIKLAYCTVSPSSLLRMRFSQCTVSPSSLLRDEVYPVCSGPLIPPERWGLRSGPLIPPERWGLPSVQWAPHRPWEMRFTQCSTSPSSLLRMKFRQCAVSPSSLLRDEVYLVRSVPLISKEFFQCAVSPSSLTLPDRWGLLRVQRAPHHS